MLLFLYKELSKVYYTSQKYEEYKENAQEKKMYLHFIGRTPFLKTHLNCKIKFYPSDNMLVTFCYIYNKSVSIIIKLISI